jgi:hypothetical protein
MDHRGVAVKIVPADLFLLPGDINGVKYAWHSKQFLLMRT